MNARIPVQLLQPCARLSTRTQCARLGIARLNVYWATPTSHFHAHGYATQSSKSGSGSRTRRPVAAPTAKKTAPGQTTTQTSPATSIPAPTAIPVQPVQGKPKTASEIMREKNAAKGQKQLTAEEQLEEMENLANIQKAHPWLDPWAQPIQTLDIHVPKAGARLGSLKTWMTDFPEARALVVDWVKNALSMFRMARANAFPGITTSMADLQWLKIWNVTKARSLRLDDWNAGIRTHAAVIYAQAQYAFAKGDKTELNKLTTGDYQARMARLLSQRAKNIRYDLRLRASTASILSLRAADAIITRQEPQIGNRLLVHALVRIDSVMALRAYTNHGVLLDDSGKRAEDQNPSWVYKDVKEYFIFEKRMWYDGPWVIREQVYL
ncbi:hypothetical protein PLICRDRAFT_176426 [Plicaturopsis crispa FD-325 SS-3]|nr:hypothetical protein PLICRDRAFT_176426 [Plicaturopsis crispa FD-325 SS-3]